MNYKEIFTKNKYKFLISAAMLAVLGLGFRSVI